MTTEQSLKVTETSDDQITIEFDGLEIQLWRSSLEADKGQPVVQIDGAGLLRVNVNDYPIWNADPDNHEHEQCQCVREFEATEEEAAVCPKCDEELVGEDPKYCPICDKEES